MAFRPTIARQAAKKLDKWLVRQYSDPEVQQHLGLKSAYRGRGAYTLLQLNDSYEHFLDKKFITSVVELGAGSGTWSQVVAGKLGWCPEPPKAPYLKKSYKEKSGKVGEEWKEGDVLWSDSVPTQFPPRQVKEGDESTELQPQPSSQLGRPATSGSTEAPPAVDPSAFLEGNGNRDSGPLPPSESDQLTTTEGTETPPLSDLVATADVKGNKPAPIDGEPPKPPRPGRGTVIAIDTKKIQPIRGVQTVQADWTLPETSTLVQGLLAGANKEGKADVILADYAVQTYDEFTENTQPTIEMCRRLFEFARRHLRSGKPAGQPRAGVLLFRAFQHPRMYRFRVDYLRPNFQSVYFLQPQARRFHEHEGYFLCLGWDLKKVPYP